MGYRYQGMIAVEDMIFVGDTEASQVSIFSYFEKVLPGNYGCFLSYDKDNLAEAIVCHESFSAYNRFKREIMSEMVVSDTGIIKITDIKHVNLDANFNFTADFKNGGPERKYRVVVARNKDDAIFYLKVLPLTEFL